MQKDIIKLIDKYKSSDIEDTLEAEYFWLESFKLLSKNLLKTIEYLNTCSSYEYEAICEIFDDLSEHFQSQELIECMERNAIRTGVDCAIDIEYAKKAMNYDK